MTAAPSRGAPLDEAHLLRRLEAFEVELAILRAQLASLMNLTAAAWGMAPYVPMPEPGRAH